MSDTLKVFGTTYTGVTGFKAKSGNNTLAYIRPEGSISISENGTVDVTAKASAVVNVQPSLQAKTVTPTKSQQIITADSLEWRQLTSATTSFESGVECPWGITLEDGLEYNIVGDYDNDPFTEYDENFILVNGTCSLEINGYTFVFTTTGVTVPFTSSVAHFILSGQVRTGYYGLSQVTVNAIPATYVTTGDANALASDIMLGKTAYVNGVKLTGTGLKYEIGTFTLESSVTVGAAVKSGVQHGLGETPDVVIVWPLLDDETPGNRGYVYLKRIMDLPQRCSSSATTQYSFCCSLGIGTVNSTQVCYPVLPSSSSYGITATTEPDATNFYLMRAASSTVWNAGSYGYLVAKKWW